MPRNDTTPPAASRPAITSAARSNDPMPIAPPRIHPTPAVYDPETYFWDKPDEHA